MLTVAHRSSLPDALLLQQTLLYLLGSKSLLASEVFAAMSWDAAKDCVEPLV